MIVLSDINAYGNTPPGKQRRDLNDDVSIDSMRVPGAQLSPASAITPEPTRTRQPISPPPNLTVAISPQTYPRAPMVPPLTKPPSNFPLVPGQLTTSPTIPTPPADRPSLEIAPRPMTPAAPATTFIPPRQVQSVTSSAGSGKTWLWILGGLVVAGGIGVTVYVVTKKPRPRRRAA